MRQKLSNYLLLGLLVVAIIAFSWDGVSNWIKITIAKNQPTRMVTLSVTHEENSTFITEDIDIDLNKTALIIIDPWQNVGIEGYEEHIQNKLIPLITLVKDANIPVIYASYSFPYHSDLPEPDYSISDNVGDHEYLDRFDTLIYAGYSANACVIVRPVGIIAMKEEGKRPIIVEDGVLAYPFNGTKTDELTIEIVKMIEWDWADGVTIQELEESLK